MAARRGHGEGSIFEDRERGGYVVLVRGVDGRRHKTRARTKTEARGRLSQLRTVLDATGTACDGNRTIGELCNQWERKVLGGRNDPSPATLVAYRWAMQLIVKELGTKRARALRVEDVERVLERLASDGKSRASLVKVRSVLGQVLTFGERRGVVNRNVARIAELPAEARRGEPGRALTVEQARQLLEVADRDRLAALWATMLFLGLRPGEANGLLWDDVDLSTGRIHVRRSLKFADGHLVLDERLKTPRSRRTLDAPSLLVGRLREHRRRQAEERLAAGPLWSSEWLGLLFTTTVGTPLHPSNVRRAFAKVTVAAALGAWHPHELRHSAASILSAEGVPLERVADVLGHDSTRMTAHFYRHAISPSVTDAAPVMDAIFGQP